jgi:hypothetical protein
MISPQFFSKYLDARKYSAIGLALACLFLAVFEIHSYLSTRNHADTDVPLSTDRSLHPDSAVQANAAAGEVAKHALRVDSAASKVPAKHVSVYKIKNLASEFSKLASAADKGDLIASRTLYRTLQDCRVAPKNAKSLEDLRKNIQDKKSYYESLPGGAEEYLLSQTAQYNRCGEPSADQSKSLARWAAQLADAGDSEARIEFAMIAQPMDFHDADYDEQRSKFVDKAKNYINEEIDSGNAGALLAMALGYMPPIVDGNSTPFQVNPFLAYEYYYAYAMSSEASPYSQSVTNILAKLEGQLSPQQVEEGRSAGASIFSHCCS